MCRCHIADAQVRSLIHQRKSEVSSSLHLTLGSDFGWRSTALKAPGFNAGDEVFGRSRINPQFIRSAEYAVASVAMIAPQAEVEFHLGEKSLCRTYENRQGFFGTVTEYRLYIDWERDNG